MIQLRHTPRSARRSTQAKVPNGLVQSNASDFEETATLMRGDAITLDLRGQDVRDVMNAVGELVDRAKDARIEEATFQVASTDLSIRQQLSAFLQGMCLLYEESSSGVFHVRFSNVASGEQNLI